MRALPFALVGILAASVFGCRAPTQITLEVRTDVPCSELSRTSLFVGASTTFNGVRPIVDTPRCVDGRVGSLVVIPSGSRDAGLGIAVVVEMHDAAGSHACLPDGPADDHCIVARRSLSFVEHSELDLPIDLRRDCRGIVCDPSHTCVHGLCRVAQVSDPSSCHGQGCSDDSLPSDGAGTDAGPDAVADVGDVSDIGDVGDAGPITVLRLAASGDTVCALRSDRTVWCWGDNAHGQLGDGTVGGFRNTPAPVLVAPGGAKLSNVVDLGAGPKHACALRADDTVMCWGYGLDGELGDGLATSSPSPVTALVTAGGAPLRGVTALGGGNRDTCAILSDHSITCWGNFGATVNPQPPLGSPVTGVTELAMGGDHACARIGDSTVRCWGYNGEGQLGDGSMVVRSAPVSVLVAPGGAMLSGVASIAAGDFYTCARMSDDAVKCWGTDGDGELGDGSGTGISNATPMNVLASPGGSPLAAVAAIAGGGGHVCALLADQTAKCWGRNGEGEVGDGFTDSVRLSPTLVVVSVGGPPLSKIVQIVGAGSTTCARTSDEAVHCWGANALGQVGNGTAAPNVPLPSRVLFP